ncbi:MAG: glycosyltransferase family 4 protein [Candidatus Paceibacterota bacterium]
MKIVITTGIYPPAIGGPAQYAKNLAETFRAKGHAVKVLTYRLEKYLPTGVRHFWFYLRCLFGFAGVDLIITLDTFSVGWPSVCAAKHLNKKIIIRTGGDFLWEGYVERTGDLVLLREFYQTRMGKLSFKERQIFRITKDILAKADKIAFNTYWQRVIWAAPYGLDLDKTTVVENFYGPKEESNYENFPARKVLVGGTRQLKWKNLAVLRRAFALAKARLPDLELDLMTADYDAFQDKIRHSYAVILVSLGDIGPNLIMDAIRLNKPFICTKETGLYDKIKDIGLFVNPQNENEIAEQIIFLSQKVNYEAAISRLQAFDFIHTWEEIAEEFLNLAQ